MTETPLDEYRTFHDSVLVPVASQLEQVIRDHLNGVPRIDRINARAKSPERFAAKAIKAGSDGSPKYSDPMIQIQDLVAARAIVYYPQDIETVSQAVLRYFRPIEVKSLVPDSEWKFGYFGRHFIFALPQEAIPRALPVGVAPQFFEFQIKTLFQHAWAEAEHDLGYKPPDQLTGVQQRSLAYTAAQAWGADRIFEELFDELGRR
jgi:ppGpp synthetase/RelA/SpoT-type nucleotidyltranferase